MTFSAAIPGVGGRRLVTGLVLAGLLASPAAAQSVDADAASLGPIPDAGSCGAAGAARDVTFTVAGVTTPIPGVRVRLTLSHTNLGDLSAVLIAPGGVSHPLFARTGQLGDGTIFPPDSSPVGDVYTFADTAAGDWWAAAAAATGSQVVPGGEYRTSVPGGAPNAGDVTSIDAAFAAVAPDGIWTLRLVDWCYGDAGTISAATLQFSTISVSSADDTYTTAHATTLTVPAPGVLANDTASAGTLTAQLMSAPAHGVLNLAAGGGVTYTPAVGFAGVETFTYRPVASGIAGPTATVSVTVTPPVVTGVADVYPGATGELLTVAAPGVLANDAAGGAPLTAVIQTSASHGFVLLEGDGGFTYTPAPGFAGQDAFTYAVVAAGGTSAPVTVTLEVSGLQPPEQLEVAQVTAQTTTLRWRTATRGPRPDSYLMAFFQADSLVFIDTLPGDTESVTYDAALDLPLDVQLFAEKSGTRSAPAETRLWIGDHVLPAAPTALTVLFAGSTLDLRWKRNYAGGKPTSYELVSGATVIQVAAAERFTALVDDVPPGTHRIQVRAVNAAGRSPLSNPVTVTVPSDCSAAPHTPQRFMASLRDGRVDFTWDPPASGGAPTEYLLTVTGAYTGVLSMTERHLRVSPPAGTYVVSVTAANACGRSAPSPAVTLSVP